MKDYDKLIIKNVGEDPSLYTFDKNLYDTSENKTTLVASYPVPGLIGKVFKKYDGTKLVIKFEKGGKLRIEN